MDELTRLHREFLKDSVRLRFDFSTTAQSRGLPPPPAQKPVPAGARTIELPAPERFAELRVPSLLALLQSRRSVRRYSDEPLPLLELAFLLWATQASRRWTRCCASTARRSSCSIWRRSGRRRNDPNDTDGNL